MKKQLKKAVAIVSALAMVVAGIKEVVNVQKPGFAKESGVYVTVPAGISKVTVNGNDDATLTAIDGAGVVVYLTSLTKQSTTRTPSNIRDSN